MANDEVTPEELDKLIAVANRLIKNRDVGTAIRAARTRIQEREAQKLKLKQQGAQASKEVGEGWSETFKHHYWRIHAKMLETREGRQHIMTHGRPEGRRSVEKYRREHGLEE